MNDSMTAYMAYMLGAERVRRVRDAGKRRHTLAYFSFMCKKILYFCLIAWRLV